MTESRESGPILELAGVRKRYGEITVVDGVDLRLEPGRIVAVLGPNGAGKTTLIKIALGLVHPDGGAVRMDGRDVLGDSGYRHRIGYMPQAPSFPANLSARELERMLDDLRHFEGAPDEELSEAFGLGEEREKPFRTLSGGNRQKVNAGLAFRHRAPVVVLDEPTAGLDPVAARVLKEKIRRERERGRAFLLTSHDLAQVQALADRIVFLLDGSVHFRGSLSELSRRTGHGDLEGGIAALMRQRAAGAGPTLTMSSAREEVA